MVKRLFFRGGQLLSRHGGFIVVLAACIVGLTVAAWPDWRSMVQAASTALIVAALSLRVAQISSREAVREQNARQARLRAMRNTYLGLSAQVRALSEGLEFAKAGEVPYPQLIVLGAFGGVSDPRNPFLAFTVWRQYKQDGRHFDFSPSGVAQFDKLEAAAAAYNRALDAARDAAVGVLTPHIATARQAQIDHVTDILERPWLSWQIQRQASQPPQNVPTSLPQPENAWFELIEQDDSPAILARVWIKGSTYQNSRPDTFGWLLAGRLDRAAQAVKDYYQQNTAATTIPASWVSRIFEETLPDLKAEPHYQGAERTFEALRAIAHEANEMLVNAIRDIQAQYEGEPAV